MKPFKILLFEDESLIANDLKVQIQQYNYVVIAIFRKAEDGLRFLEGIQKTEDLPDIVLMDISLAGKMNGIEAAQIIAENYPVALVFLTGISQLDLFENSFKSKPYAFLIKPFDIHQALVSIRLALYQSSLETRVLKTQEELEENVTERIRELKLTNGHAGDEI